MKYIETSVLSRASQRVNNNFYFKCKKNMKHDFKCPKHLKIFSLYHIKNIFNIKK